MPRLHRAAWLLPIVSPPVRNGWVLVHRGSIVACGGPGESVPAPGRRRGESLEDTEEVRYDEPVAILPGLVNAHTHLELSWMRGRIPPADSMPAWAAALIAERRSAGADATEPIIDAIGEAWATGTALVGDVSNTLAAYEPIVDSHLSATVFHELIGFDVPDPQRVVREAQTRVAALTPLAWIRSTIAPHAPYSVSPDLLAAIAASGASPFAIHLAESAEEVDFLRSGSGPWRELLSDLGSWSESWSPPSCRPVEYLDRLGLVSERLIAVHGVQLHDSELRHLADSGATLVTCPRSNEWVGAGAPPVDRFYASGVRVAIGTDSLASVEDLNMFAELAAVRRLAPRVEASRILRSATLNGAGALGFGSDLGSIEPGKRAELIAVRVPPDVGDVEEYLLSGLHADAVRWIDPD